MSGVRVVDPKLREIGLTLPGFVERGKVIASLPSLGLLTLAALCPTDWEPSYVEIDELGPDAANEITGMKPDLVAISSLSARVDDAYALAEAIQRAGIPVVIGGLHATVLPDEALRHATAVVAGDGELAWQRVLADAAVGKLAGIYKNQGYCFADGDPVPRYDLLDVEKYNRLTLQASRGCPLDCSFCAASRLLGPPRRKPISQIRRELEAILRIWPRPFIELADDNTFLANRWSAELLDLFSEYRIKWFTETDISIADKPNLLDKLADSGCVQVLIGLESAVPESLATVDPRGWKRRRMERYAESVARIQTAGVSVNGCFVLGFDQDGPEVFEETLAMIGQLDLAEVQLTILTPFPGTSTYAQLRQQKRLFFDRFWDKCTLFDLTFRPKRMSAEEFHAGFLWLVRQVYSQQATAARKKRFRSCVRERFRKEKAKACAKS